MAGLFYTPLYPCLPVFIPFNPVGFSRVRTGGTIRDLPYPIFYPLRFILLRSSAFRSARLSSFFYTVRSVGPAPSIGKPDGGFDEADRILTEDRAIRHGRSDSGHAILRSFLYRGKYYLFRMSRRELHDRSGQGRAMRLRPSSKIACE